MRTLLCTLMLLVFAGLLYQPEQGIAKTGQPVNFKIKPGNFKTGDLILRQGKGFISELFRKTSMHERLYSHAGIIQVTRDGVFVVHMIGGPDNQGSELRSEPIEEFCNSTENRSFAVYRYSFLSGKEPEINAYLEDLKKTTISFDEHFDLTTENSLYCTELVYKMCLYTSGYLLNLSLINGKKYVGLDDLYKVEVAKLITKQNF